MYEFFTCGVLVLNYLNKKWRLVTEILLPIKSFCLKLEYQSYSPTPHVINCFSKVRIYFLQAKQRKLFSYIVFVLLEMRLVLVRNIHLKVFMMNEVKCFKKPNVQLEAIFPYFKLFLLFFLCVADLLQSTPLHRNVDVSHGRFKC